jgi:hypothetical protein
MVVLPGGDLMVGGSFTSVDGISASALFRYSPTTGAVTRFGTSSFTQDIRALALLPDGDVVCVGGFAQFNGVGAPCVSTVRYNPTTGAFSTMGTGLSNSSQTFVYAFALATLPSGDLLAGGEFIRANGQAASGIVRCDGITGAWTAGPSGGGVSLAYALAVHPSGDVYIGGSFLAAGDVSASKVARLNLATKRWSALGSGVSGAGNVQALCILPDGDVMVGGGFTTAGGVPAGRIARFHPTPVAAPVIVVHPSPAVTTAGAGAVFAVYATVASDRLAPTYQWRRVGTPINTASNPSAAAHPRSPPRPPSRSAAEHPTPAPPTWV